MLGLRRDHDSAALEAACARAIALNAIGYAHICRLLLADPLQVPLALALPIATHEHVRGGDYYDSETAHAA